MSKGKTLRKQEALFTDNSGTIRLVLWETDIGRVTSSSVYEIKKIVVREYQNARYLTLNKSSSIKQSDNPIVRNDSEAAELLPHAHSVDCPVAGVLSIQRFSSCKKCQTKLVPSSAKPFEKCTECGLTQLLAKCQQRLIANVMFDKDDTTALSLLFDDKLKQLHDIYNKQVNGKENFDTLDDDSIMEFLLMVQATIFYNQKKNVLSVAPKNNEN